MLLAKGIIRLVEDRELFTRMSRNAAERVRLQSSSDIIIEKEINLLKRVTK